MDPPQHLLVDAGSCTLDEALGAASYTCTDRVLNEDLDNDCDSPLFLLLICVSIVCFLLASAYSMPSFVIFSCHLFAALFVSIYFLYRTLSVLFSHSIQCISFSLISTEKK